MVTFSLWQHSTNFSYCQSRFKLSFLVNCVNQRDVCIQEMARKECSWVLLLKIAHKKWAKNPLHDTWTPAEMNEPGRSMDSWYPCKNFVFFSWVLNKGTEFFKTGNCTGIYILEYIEYQRKKRKSILIVFWNTIHEISCWIRMA